MCLDVDVQYIDLPLIWPHHYCHMKSSKILKRGYIENVIFPFCNKKEIDAGISILRATKVIFCSEEDSQNNTIFEAKKVNTQKDCKIKYMYFWRTAT